MERIPNGVYTLEFRSEAVKLVEQEGLSVDQAAKRLSVPKSSLGQSGPIRQVTADRTRAATAHGDGNGIGTATQRVGRSKAGA